MDGRWKHAFNTFAYSSYPKWLPCFSREQAIDLVADAGYDAIEIGCAAPIAWPYYLQQQDLDATWQHLQRRGLQVSSLVPPPGGGPGLNPASPDPAERRATVDLYAQMIRLARAWRAPLLIFVPGWLVGRTPFSSGWQYALDVLGRVADEARVFGIRIVIEPVSANTNLVDTPDLALKMAHEVQLDNVGVMFDTYAALYRHEAPEDYVERLEDRLWHIHLADEERRAPNAGRVNYAALLDRLAAVGFDGYLTMEIGLTDRGISPRGIADEALEYLKRIESKLGGSADEHSR